MWEWGTCESVSPGCVIRVCDLYRIFVLLARLILISLCVGVSLGCLSALVYQHAMTPQALPCKLVIPTRGEARRVCACVRACILEWICTWIYIQQCGVRNFCRICFCCVSDIHEDVPDIATPTNPAAELLKQGAGKKQYLSQQFC